MNKELVKKLREAAHRADNNSFGTSMSEVVEEVIAKIGESEKCFNSAHKELITLYKSIENFAQPRVLSHIILIGQMIEKGLCIKEGIEYGEHEENK